MDVTPYLATLRENLTAAASVGDEQARRTAAVLTAALEPAARLALLNAVSDFAAEVTARLDDHVVDVRLDGKDIRVVVTPTGHDEAGADERTGPPPPPPNGESGDVSRVTLRLVEELKAKAEQAAADHGQSLNAFMTQALRGALQRGGPHHGGRGPWGDPADWHAAKRQWKQQWREDLADPGHGRGRGGSRVQGWVQP